MTGLVQLAFGLLRLGGMVRYVSNSVVIGSRKRPKLWRTPKLTARITAAETSNKTGTERIFGWCTLWSQAGALG